VSDDEHWALSNAVEVEGIIPAWNPPTPLRMLLKVAREMKSEQVLITIYRAAATRISDTFAEVLEPARGEIIYRNRTVAKFSEPRRAKYMSLMELKYFYIGSYKYSLLRAVECRA